MLLSPPGQVKQCCCPENTLPLKSGQAVCARPYDRPAASRKLSLQFYAESGIPGSVAVSAASCPGPALIPKLVCPAKQFLEPVQGRIEVLHAGGIRQAQMTLGSESRTGNQRHSDFVE